MVALVPDDSRDKFSDATWGDIIQAVKGTYSEPVAYQELLEAQNQELEDLRCFMTSVLSSMSELRLVVDKDHQIVRAGGAGSSCHIGHADC